MEYIYVLIDNNNCFEDIIIIIDKKVAIEESKKNSNLRVEIFSKNENKYEKTHCYYKNGNLIEP